MDEKTSQYFGLIIAFLIPGMVGLYALSFFEPSLREWFGFAAENPTTVGGFLFVIVGSIGVGVFISGLRWCLLDHVLRVFPQAPAFQHERRTEEQKDKAYQDARAQHFMFFLFYANLLVASPILFVSWFAQVQPRPLWSDVGIRAGVLVLGCLVLYLSAQDALRKFDRKAERILGLVQPSKEHIREG